VTRRFAPALVAALVLLAANCGGSSGPSMTSDAARQLQVRDQAVHLALANGDRGLVDRTLADLRHTVATLQGRGELSAGRAQSILSAVDAVQTDLVLLPTTTTSTTTPPPRDQKKHGDQGGGGNGD
jgi:hypothetical protein